MKGKLLFLGTGASLGVPMLGCQCEVCQSTSPFNKRLRPSALLQINQKQLLIDVGPDFRYQALRSHLTHLDGILFTHSHQDHTAGIDDLRPLSFKRETPLPFLCSAETAKDIKERFHFAFKPIHTHPLTSRLEAHLLPDKKGKIIFQGIEVGYYTFYQDNMGVNAYRFGDLAYVSDIKNFDPDIFDWLKGVKVLVVSALRFTPSNLHLSVDEAVDFANQVGVEKAWLTHTSHDLDYEKTNAYLPSHIQLAYDGLEIEFSP